MKCPNMCFSFSALCIYLFVLVTHCVDKHSYLPSERASLSTWSVIEHWCSPLSSLWMTCQWLLLPVSWAFAFFYYWAFVCWVIVLYCWYILWKVSWPFSSFLWVAVFFPRNLCKSLVDLYHLQLSSFNLKLAISLFLMVSCDWWIVFISVLLSLSTIF